VASIRALAQALALAQSAGHKLNNNGTVIIGHKPKIISLAKAVA
jgi:hypothetical protein